MTKNDLKYGGSIDSGIKHNTFPIRGIPALPVWDMMKDEYGEPLFEEGIGARMGVASRYLGKKVLVAYIDEFDVTKNHYSLKTYKGCNFAEGKLEDIIKLKSIVLDMNGDAYKIRLNGIINMVEVNSLLSFDSQQLLQFTFNTGHTSMRNAAYLREVVGTNSFTAAKDMSDALIKESNLFIPVRLGQIRPVDLEYLKSVDGLKSGFSFDKHKQPEYDNF